MASEFGTLLIRVQGTVERLDFRDDDERDDFLRYVGDTLDESWRQKLLTWRGNRVSSKG